MLLAKCQGLRFLSALPHVTELSRILFFLLVAACVEAETGCMGGEWRTDVWKAFYGLKGQTFLEFSGDMASCAVVL